MLTGSNCQQPRPSIANQHMNRAEMRDAVYVGASEKAGMAKEKGGEKEGRRLEASRKGRGRTGRG
eukprot:1087925-Heterocapsa_arctica.AAC.1